MGRYGWPASDTRVKTWVISGEIWLIGAHLAKVAAGAAGFSAQVRLIAQNGGPNIVDGEDLPACSGESLSYSSR